MISRITRTASFTGLLLCARYYAQCFIITFSHFTPPHRAPLRSSPVKWDILITPDLQLRKWMVLSIMKIRKKSCSASLFPAVSPPNLTTDPGSTSETVSGPSRARSGIPLGAKPQAPSTQTFGLCPAVTLRYLLALGWGWGVRQTGGHGQASTYLRLE